MLMTTVDPAGLDTTVVTIVDPPFIVGVAVALVDSCEPIELLCVESSKTMVDEPFELAPGKAKNESGLSKDAVVMLTKPLASHK